MAGSVDFDGAPLAPFSRERPSALRRRMQMVHQSADTAMNPRHRIGDILGRPLQFFLGLKGRAKRERVRELLSLIELEPDAFIDRLPAELSGGQKQRVCIARALAAEPDFIIEVTSALDQIVAGGILRLLDRLQQEMGLTYLFITHDIATVRSIADEVAVMHRGRIVEQGPKKAIFTRPHDPYTELLPDSVPEMDPDWRTTRLRDRPGRLAPRPERCASCTSLQGIEMKWFFNGINLLERSVALNTRSAPCPREVPAQGRDGKGAAGRGSRVRP